MVANGIRDKISAALRSERASDQLRHRLEQQVPELRTKLVLPEDGPVMALMAFITDYVESVPSCIELVASASREYGFHAYAAPFLNMAEDYFLHPPRELSLEDGLEALLDEAFLAHRLLEEVNDHHIKHLGRPLLPVDMTEANIIVHHLLGDDLANKLDRLVHFTASQLLEREYVWGQARRQADATVGQKPLFSSANLAGSPQQIRLRLAS